MAQFTVNAQRFDPYKNFKFRVKWDGKYVAGVVAGGTLFSLSVLAQLALGALRVLQLLGGQRGADLRRHAAFMAPVAAQVQQRRRRAAAQHQGGDQQFSPKRKGHSITSPRRRNLAMAVEPTKPNSAISMAASK